MKKDLNFILRQFMFFFIKCLIPMFVVGLIFMDIKTFGTVSEVSFVEFGEEFFLLASAGVLAYVAKKKDMPGLWCVVGFLLCMLIRELDAYFDDIFHGAWVYAAVPCAAFFVGLAAGSGKEKAVHTLAEYMRAPAFKTMSFGMMVILVYSRLFGAGKLWHLIMGEKFVRAAKNVAEEGTELFGYSIVFLAAVEYAYSLLKNKD